MRSLPPQALKYTFWPRAPASMLAHVVPVCAQARPAKLAPSTTSKRRRENLKLKAGWWDIEISECADKDLSLEWRNYYILHLPLMTGAIGF